MSAQSITIMQVAPPLGPHARPLNAGTNFLAKAAAPATETRKTKNISVER